MGGYDNKPASSSFWVFIHGKIVVLWQSRVYIVDVDIEMEECMCFDGASGQSEVGMAATMTTSSWAWASVPQRSILQCRSAFARVIVLAPTYGSIYLEIHIFIRN